MIKTGVLNIPTYVRMTPCPPRLHLQTLWTGVILTGKMTLRGDKGITKVDHAMKIGVLNIPSSYQDDPLSSKTLTPHYVDRGHLDRENRK